MAILVLGGAGYIGSHTVYELIEAGKEVIVADNLQTGFRAAVHPKAKFYELDIRDRGARDTLFQAEKIDGVIHFAASSQVGESMQNPLKYYDNNLYGGPRRGQDCIFFYGSDLRRAGTCTDFGK